MPGYQLLPVDEINLDKTNPRIQRLMAMYQNDPTDDQIGLALGAGAEVGVGGGTTFSSLRASIKINNDCSYSNTGGICIINTSVVFGCTFSHCWHRNHLWFIYFYVHSFQ